MHSVFRPVTFRRKWAPISAQLQPGGHPKRQCLSGRQVHADAPGAGILADVLPAKAGTWCVVLRHLGWHGDGQSSSLRASRPAIVAILPLDLDRWVQLNIASCCGVHRHRLILCPFSNMFLCSVVMSLVFKSKPLLGFSLSFISCVKWCWSFIPRLTSPFPKAHMSCLGTMQLALSPHCAAPLQHPDFPLSIFSRC